MKLCIIGAGNMANEYIKVCQHLNYKILGIHSLLFEEASLIAEAISGCKAYKSIKEMYDDTKSDVVINTCSAEAIKTVTHEMFKFKWICLLEKPIGLNYEESIEINKCALKNNSAVYVSFNRRYYSSTLTVIANLKKDDGRRLIEINGQEDPFILLKKGFPQIVIDNWMYVNAIHLIDMFNIFGRGDIANIQHIIPWKDKYTDFVITKLIFASGDIGIYKALWNRPGPWSISISTKNKLWQLKPIENAYFQNKNERFTNKIEDDIDDISYKPGLVKLLIELNKIINNLPHTMTSLAESIKTMKLVKDIYNV